MYEAAASCKDIAGAPVTNWEPHCVTLAGYCYAVRHGIKVRLVTPYRVSHNVTVLRDAVRLQVCTHLNPLNPELNPICYLLALLGAHHFLHLSKIRVKLLTFRLLMSYIYGAPILDVSRSHTTTQHSR
jgi:hypothetical protein